MAMAKAEAEAEAEAAAAAAAAASTNVSAAGRESAPDAASTSATAASDDEDTDGGGATVTMGTSDSGVQLAYVQGVPVNAHVARQVSAMINAAAADGVSLWIDNSYRSVSLQIELRKQHCGTSYYAVYEMSAASCSPATAQPGHSQHQLGLAIDFNGCSSQSSACYRWLAANASRFGYYNLPGEPWHWSTTGT